MVNLTIDGKQISVKENTTIMEAAASNGIPIPHLCYLKEINEIAACRVCVVELEGKDRLITSCNNGERRNGHSYQQSEGTKTQTYKR
jgi:NADP-reducing hydrogenase subunit HndD